jgi:hypothetical protein
MPTTATEAEQIASRSFHMLTTPKPTPRPVCSNMVECCLIEMTGLARATKVLRHSDGVISTMTREDQHQALYVVVDALLIQVGRLNHMLLGERMAALEPPRDLREGDNDDEEEDEPDDHDGLGALLAVSQLTREQLEHMSEHGRNVLVSHCQRVMADVDRVERKRRGQPDDDEQEAADCAEDTICDAHAGQELEPLDKQTKCLMRMGGMTDADVAAMSPHGRKVLVSYCQSLTQAVINAQAAEAA